MRCFKKLMASLCDSTKQKGKVMITINKQQKNSKRMYWCQACNAPESKTIMIANNDIQSSSFRLCDKCLKELADKIQEELGKQQG